MVPARCNKCGHEGALPPDDPLTGAKRFDCPICGEAALTPIEQPRGDELEPPRRVSLAGQWVKATLRSPVATIYKPASPRPAGWLAGSIADLRALLPTMLAVVSAGWKPAVLSFAVLVIVAAVVMFIPIVSICVYALIAAGPLSAFGLAAMGEQPTTGRVLELALRRTPLLALTIVLPSIAFSIPLFVMFGLVVARLEIAALICGITLLVVEAFLYVRIFLLWHIVAVLANAGDKRRAIADAPRLARGRQALLGAVAATPFAIMILASPTPPAQQIAVSWLGSEGAMLLHIAVGAIGVVASIFLGAAMLASAFAIILATPIERSSRAS